MLADAGNLRRTCGLWFETATMRRDRAVSLPSRVKARGQFSKWVCRLAFGAYQTLHEASRVECIDAINLCMGGNDSNIHLEACSRTQVTSHDHVSFGLKWRHSAENDGLCAETRQNTSWSTWKETCVSHTEMSLSHKKKKMNCDHRAFTNKVCRECPRVSIEYAPTRERILICTKREVCTMGGAELTSMEWANSDQSSENEQSTKVFGLFNCSVGRQEQTNRFLSVFQVSVCEFVFVCMRVRVRVYARLCSFLCLCVFYRAC